MHTEKIRLAVVLGVFAIASMFVAKSVLAQPPQDGTRPGWGYGDKNHVHTGPPGQSVRPANSR